MFGSHFVLPNQFTAIAQPLHALTKKNRSFYWDQSCQSSFEILKRHMTTAPILSYPALEKPFILETNTSILGLGAILSQAQNDGCQHPVAYASRSLTTAEKGSLNVKPLLLSGLYLTFAIICMASVCQSILTTRQ